jgi:TRAP transporter TAXI family solute receptor
MKRAQTAPSSFSIATTCLTVFAAMSTSACDSGPREPHTPRASVRLVVAALTPGASPARPFAAEALAAAMPDIDIEVHERAAAFPSVKAIQDGTADLSFSFADVGYLAYAGLLEPMSPPYDRLRGIAMLHVTAVHLLSRAASGISTVAGLAGRRVSIGPPQSATALTARTVLRSYGIDQDVVTVPTETLGDAATRLQQGTIDAMFVNVNFPPADLVVHAVDAGARIVPIDGWPVSRLRREYPFLRVAVIPAGAYPHHPTAIHTVGVHGMFLCRVDLDEDIVYRITKGLLEGLPSLAVGLPPLQSVNLDEAPATPIPLHPGAARYYRERELSR